MVVVIFRKRMAGHVADLQATSKEGVMFASDVDFAAGESMSNVVTSRASVDIGTDYHLPVLDLDFAAELEPSTTNGHYHLYLDRALTWEEFVKVLDVLGEVGILETGYVEAAKVRGYTSVRLPWVKKPKKEASNV